MIDSKEKLKHILKVEFSNYFDSKESYLTSWLKKSNNYYIWTYQKSLRKLEYYYNRLNKAKGISRLTSKFGFIISARKVNSLGRKLSIDMWHSIFDEGLMIFHSANGIVVNSKTKVGKNCHLHGNNCIGNNAKSEYVPIIGDNCTLGVGAAIIGDVQLANNITVGAGAIVTKSYLKEGLRLTGIPASVKD